MKNILVVNSSLSSENGNSNKLTSKLVTRLTSEHNGLNVVERNLNEMNIPHLTMEEMVAWRTDKTARTSAQAAQASLSDTLIAELQQADAVIIGMPMYNFGVPSTFKAWIDRVARAGITFKYTETGPQGLLSNKKVYLLAARGGKYAGTPKDSQSQYLKDVLGFIGLSDIEFVYVEGLAMGDDAAQSAWSFAEKELDRLSA
ncbi:NAD(P)H-dependent oxidoreductase [Paraglaciecola sp.]|uniref:FMN-dependent NADH-azoreductase n=1 Tax=Paraglaciecola sp. TaxID=1920173 RepID=UPI0030F407FB